MEIIIKVFLLALFALVVFCRNAFPSALLYWAAYCVMFALVPALWASMFWVSKKKAAAVLGSQPEFDIFCAKVPADPADDFQRGRLCLSQGKIVLIKKTKKGLEKTWSVDKEKITSVNFANVAGRRCGFILNYNGDSASFVCRTIDKHKEEFTGALGL